MASYTSSARHTLSPFSNTGFFVDFNSEHSYTIEKRGDPDATEFAVGDMLNLTNDGDTLLGQYVGTSADGIVVFMEDFGTYWLLNDTLLDIGSITIVAPEPFPVCFVKGSLITTTRGPVAIEDLVPGDIVQGSSGWRTVKWLGWRTYGPASFLTKEGKSRIAPVRIRAHAIADNVPSSDLLVSAWHHLFVEGKLVQAGDLVNGTTIVQETNRTEVTYYHVELDQFDVVMAHGVYSESWADGGNRDFFQNVDVTSLRPEDKVRRRAPRPGFDHLVLRKGPELAAIARNVSQRAKDISLTMIKAQKAA